MNKGLLPGQILNFMEKKFGIKASYWKGWMAKEEANAIVRGTPEDNFSNLPAYLHMLQKVNPGTIAELKVDAATSYFQYCFLPFGASIKGNANMRKVCVIVMYYMVASWTKMYISFILKLFHLFVTTGYIGGWDILERKIWWRSFTCNSARCKSFHISFSLCNCRWRE